MLKMNNNLKSLVLFLFCTLNVVAFGQVELTAIKTSEIFDYSQIPYNQLSELKPCLEISNNLGYDLTGAKATIQLFSGSGQLTDETIVYDIDNNELVTICSMDPYLPTETGVYEIVGNPDSEYNDIPDTISFEITNHTYARDRLLLAEPAPFANGDDGFGITNSYEVGNLFEIVQNDAIGAINVYLHPNTELGALIYGVIYKEDQGDWLYLDQTSDHTITFDEIGSWITLPFSFPTQIGPGERILVGAGHYGGPDAVYVGMGGNIVDADENTVMKLDGTDNTWYSQDSVPMIRMINTINTATRDFDTHDKMVKVYPNPTNGIIQINRAETMGAITAELINAMGQSFFTHTISNDQQTLDLSQVPAGMYVLKLTGEGYKTAKRILVSRN